MAVQSIIASIDAYISQLESARALLAGYSQNPDQDDPEARSPRRRRSSPENTSAAEPSDVASVAVQVIPPKGPRGRRASTRSAAAERNAFSGPVPQGPVVVKPAKLALVAKPGAVSKAGASTAPGGVLQELAQEVRKRLNRTNR